MVILQKNETGTTVEPYTLFQHFKFENYNYDDAYFTSFDRWVMVLCKNVGSLNNDTILMCNYSAKTVDIVNYNAFTAVQNNGIIYIGDSLSKSVYQIFSGYDDMGLPLEAFWTSKDELYGAERLKKTRRLRFKGNIDPDQSVEVYVDYDSAGFSLAGTISGKGDYVNYQTPATIGSPLIGEQQVGGDDIAQSYPFFMEMKLKTPKFRKRTVKLLPKGIGYFDLDTIIDYDILTFENRIPRSYREKQNVSLNGLQNNLDNPQ